VKQTKKVETLQHKTKLNYDDYNIY